MPHTFFVRRRFHAGHLLLGRLIHRRIDDRHYAEGVFILVIALGVFGLTLANYLSWALMQQTIVADASGAAALNFWIIQAGATLIFLLTCVVGFKPALHVRVDDKSNLTINQGHETLEIALNDIRDVSHITALRFHRQFRKYSATHAYFVRLPQFLLLLDTKKGSIVLGLEETDADELAFLLQPSSAPIVYAPSVHLA